MKGYLSFRIRAFVVHLLFSVCIAVAGLFFVFLVWHPAPLEKAVGVTFIFLIMLAIDVILGPLLTLFLAKKGKKGLKFDLTLIVLIQMIAYIYGMYNIATSRPAWIVFDTFRFDVVQANDIDKSHINKAHKKYQSAGWLGPAYVAVKPSIDDKEKNKRLFYEIENGFAPSMQPQLYQPLEKAWSDITKKQKALKNLQEFNANKQLVKSISEKHPKATGWLPLKAYNQNMVVLVDSKNKQILKIVDLRPWKE